MFISKMNTELMDVSIWKWVRSLVYIVMVTANTRGWSYMICVFVFQMIFQMTFI